MLKTLTKYPNEKSKYNCTKNGISWVLAMKNSSGGIYLPWKSINMGFWNIDHLCRKKRESNFSYGSPCFSLSLPLSYSHSFSLSLSIYIYIYMYMCVCVCVCMYVCVCVCVFVCLRIYMNLCVYVREKCFPWFLDTDSDLQLQILRW